MRTWSRTSWFLFLVHLLAGCSPTVAPAPEAPASLSSAITGGVAAPELTSVVLLLTDVATCTGTLVSPTKVLTAAHCVDTQRTGLVRFYGTDGIDRGFVRYVAEPHPAFGRVLVGHPKADVAVATLEHPVTRLAPMALRTASSEELTGQMLTLVGLGDHEDAESYGRRKLDMRLSRLEEHMLVFDDDDTRVGVGVDSGDSGGPALVTEGGIQKVAGVASTGNKSRGTSNYQRLDLVKDFLEAQGVVARACESGADCTAGEACVLGTCAPEWVVECDPLESAFLHTATSCPDGRVCRIVPTAGGSLPRCVPKETATATAACSASNPCQEEGAGCIDEGGGGRCAPLCDRTFAVKAGCACEPLTGSVRWGELVCPAASCEGGAACPSLVPHCEDSSRKCVECLEDTDCGADETCSYNICNLTEGTQCVRPSDCLGYDRCDEASGRCVGCDSNSDCTDGARCIRAVCVPCATDAQCGGDTVCRDAKCVPLEASDCEPSTGEGCPDGLACLVSRTRAFATCTEAGSAEEGAACNAWNACAPGTTCVSGVCAPVCSTPLGSGQGLCGDGRICVAFYESGPGACTACNEYWQCGSDPTRPFCSEGVCVACHEDAQCGAGWRCVNNQCEAEPRGCQSDAACPSGQTCDVPSGHCVEAPAEEPTGCGCGTAPSSAVLGAALLVVLGGSRRRPHSQN
ncbi:S1 family peptidase [Archangium gephyra]|nr:S1 family peptidase [Archangium gephyra]